MALGNKKTSKPGKKQERDNSGKRYIGSVWENEGKDGKDNYLSLSIDNQDPAGEHHKGFLLWHDVETGKYYKVKSAAIFTADKGPANLMNKIVIDINNDYHVEELESE